MKILHRPPRLCWVIQLFFKYDFNNIHALSFGNTIYSKHNPISLDLIEHEKVHLKQMKHSRIYAAWHFIKYILSKRFRYETELKAYRVQYNFCKKKGWFLDPKKIALHLAGEEYKKCISYDEALMDILR